MMLPKYIRGANIFASAALRKAPPLPPFFEPPKAAVLSRKNFVRASSLGLGQILEPYAD